MTITLDLTGITDALGEFVDEVAGIEERAQDLTPVLRPRAQLLSTVIDNSFRFSRTPGGDPWAPLDPKTAERRRQSNPQPLINTGELRASAKTTRAERNRIVFGASGAKAEVAQFQHEGTSSIPAREFLPLGDEGFRKGPAREWRERTEQKVMAYILRGDL